MVMDTPTAEVTWEQLLAYFPHRRITNYLRPVPEHGVVYVKNPKAGCSTIMLWLDRIHTGELDHEFTNIHKQHRLPTIAQVGRRKVARMLSGKAYRFSFVRNPMRRFESSYWDKIVYSENWRPKVQATLGLPLDKSASLSFEQFLSAVEQQDPVGEMDPHWRPQNINLLHPLVTFDRVGRLESFDADLETIREEAGLPVVPYRQMNPSKRHVTESVYDNRPDLVRRVEKLYADDFELYGY
jgi:Sulfotransferase family